MKSLSALVILMFLAVGTLAQTPADPQTQLQKKPLPPQYKPPTAEPLPETSLLPEPPPAPAIPAGWLEKLNDKHEALIGDHLRIHVFRLRPGDDLMGGIRAYVKANHIQASVLLSAVGSLTQASIRYANQQEAHILKGHFEIVSINGTVEDGGEHIHLSIATGQGNVVGGHLMTGCRIYTTGEITLGEIVGARFTREADTEGSGWEELKVYPAKP